MKKRFSIIIISVLLVTMLSSTAFGAGRVLYNGMSGNDVYALQQMLAAYGYFFEEPTGYFGSITENAVYAFQRDFALETDGIAGPVTCSYLGISTDDDSYSYNDTDSVDGSYLDVNLGYRTLSNGMSGSDVYTLQALLADYGYYYYDITGYYGELTEAAVINFQYDYGLDADGIAGPITIGTLTGSYSSSYEDSSYYYAYGDAIVDAVYRTPSTSSGYCAAWVTQVLKNAGVLTYDITDLRSSYYSYASTSGLAHGYYADSTGFNANDYWAYVCWSTDPDDLQPGMVVATRSSYTYLGMQFGHVGIYVGDGKIVSSVGYLETLSVDEFYRRYNNTEMGSTMAWGYLPY